MMTLKINICLDVLRQLYLIPMSTNKTFYHLEITSEIKLSLSKIDAQKEKINEKKKNNPDIWHTIQDKLKVDWTYDSNAIEGSTLTRGETLFFLQEGLTVEGKPFKDFLDAKNHSEAIDYLFDVIKNDRPISESIIKELNALLLHGIKHTPAIDGQGQKTIKPATPGKYKQYPNHVQQLDGTIHHYTDPLQVPSDMAELCTWIKESDSKIHPIIISAIAHYNMVRIHPFDDGNGRGARILMNLILIKKGYIPAIVKNKDRRRYIECLKDADDGTIGMFVAFICHSLDQTQQGVLGDFL